MASLWNEYPKPSELFALYERSVREFPNQPERHFPLYRIFVTLEPALAKRLVYLGTCLADGRREQLAELLGVPKSALEGACAHASINLLDLYSLFSLLSWGPRYTRIIERLRDSEKVSGNSKRSKLLLRMALSVHPQDNRLHSRMPPRRCLSVEKVEELSAFVLPFLKDGKKDIPKFNIRHIEAHILGVHLATTRYGCDLALPTIRLLHESASPLNAPQIAERLGRVRNCSKALNQTLLLDARRPGNFFKRLIYHNQSYWVLAVETEKHDLRRYMP